jgi:hypothetical protein
MKNKQTNKYDVWLISFWLYKESNLKDWKNVFTYSPMNSAGLWLCCSNSFHLSKKSCFRCAANHPSPANVASQCLKTFFPWGVLKVRKEWDKSRLFTIAKWRSANFWCITATLWGATLFQRDEIIFESLPWHSETSCCFSLVSAIMEWVASTFSRIVTRVGPPQYSCSVLKSP